MENRIDYKGMTSQPSDYQCGDGDMQVAVNAEFRDGAFHATREPKNISFNKEDFKPLYVHRPNSDVGDIVIGALKSDDKYVLKAYKFSNGSEINISEDVTINDIEDIGIFQSIGNIVVYSFCCNISYLLYSNNRYNYVNNIDYEIDFSFETSLDSPYNVKPKKNSYKYRRTEYSYIKNVLFQNEDVNLKLISGLTKYEEPTSSEMEDDKVSDKVFAKLNEIRESQLNKHRFIYPRILQYAVKSYSGDYFYISPRIYLYPINEPVYFGDYQMDSVEKPTYYPVRFEEGTLDVHKGYRYNLKNLAILYNSYQVLIDVKSEIDKMKYLLDSNLVSSIDFFLSNNIVNHKSKYVFALWQNLVNGIDFGNLPTFVYKTENQIKEEIESSPVYLVKSYTLNELINSSGKINLSEDIETYKLQTLEQQKKLEYSINANNLMCERLETYNNRILLLDLKRILKNDSSLKTLCPPITYYDEYFDADTDYPFQQTYDKDKNIGLYKKFEVEKATTTIKLSNNTIVGCERTERYAFIPLYYNYNYDSGSSGFLYLQNGNETKQISLVKSDFLNSFRYVYLLAKDMEKDVLNSNENIDYEDKYNQSNCFINSEVYNPFVFKTASIVNCGSKKILNIASNARATSQGQFGQYPLYAFCTDGVFAINVGNDGTLQSCVPLSYDILTDANSVGQMETDIVFATRNGIIALNGGERRLLLSADKTATYAYDNCPKNHQEIFMQGKDGKSGAIKNIVGISPLQMTNLYDYITNGVRFAYDATHARLIAYNPKYDYSYIMETSSGMWSVFNKGFDSHLNIPEECLMIRKEDGQYKVYDYSSDNVVDLQKSYLITRPFKLGYPDIHKSIHSIIQRGVFCNINDVQQCVYASNDMYHWFPVWSSTNIYLRGMRGSGYKYYRLVLFIPKFKQEETLQGATFEFDPRLTNQQR